MVRSTGNLSSMFKSRMLDDVISNYSVSSN